MSLERFRAAQNDPVAGFDVALKELQDGQKVGHWIWYIFPQLRGLGHSAAAQFYGIESEAEAKNYLRDPFLSGHLLSAAQAVADQLSRGVVLEDLMGSSTDSLKVSSSLTLFRQVAGGLSDPADSRTASIAKVAGEILQTAQEQGYPRCRRTIDALAHRGSAESASG